MKQAVASRASCQREGETPARPPPAHAVDYAVELSILHGRQCFKWAPLRIVNAFLPGRFTEGLKVKRPKLA